MRVKSLLNSRYAEDHQFSLYHESLISDLKNFFRQRPLKTIETQRRRENEVFYRPESQSAAL